MLLLTVDALRADQPWTGYDGIQTPHLSQLAKESVVYTRAYALSNTTAASLGGARAPEWFEVRTPAANPEDGRKLYAGTALFAPDGELLALARQTWIVPKG